MVRVYAMFEAGNSLFTQQLERKNILLNNKNVSTADIDIPI